MEESTDSNSQNKFLPNGKSIECSDCDDESGKESTPALDVRLCLIGSLASDQDVVQAAQSFQVPVVTSSDGSEWELTTPSLTVFVMEDFSGPIFDKLYAMGHRLLGPIALRELAEKGLPLPQNTRPLYTLAMQGLVVCFTGFRKKDEVARLITLIHHMGGSVRKDMASKVTHLVANKCSGDKYQYALTFRVPVMATSWVHNAWAMRPQIGFSATDQNYAEHKLKPFHGARVCFLGFPEEEQKHMAEVLVENGGVLTDMEDPACSHLVVEAGECLPEIQNALSRVLASPPPPAPHTLPNRQNVHRKLLVGSASPTESESKTPRPAVAADRDNDFADEKSSCIVSKQLFKDDTDNNFLQPNWSSPMSSQASTVSFSTPLPHRTLSSQMNDIPENCEDELTMDCSLTDYDFKPPSALCTVKHTMTEKVEVMQQSVEGDKKRSETYVRREFDYYSSFCPYPKELLEKRSRLSICLPRELNISHDPSLMDGDMNATICGTTSSPVPRKRRKTLSPKKTPKKNNNNNPSSGFKTPVLTSIRRSLRLKSVNQLARWLSNADIPPSVLPPSSPSSVSSASASACGHGVPPQSLTCASSHSAQGRRVDEDSIVPVPAHHHQRMLSVVDESSVSSLPNQVPSSTHIVKAEWFWASVQNEGCVDEKDYLFEDYLESLVSPNRRTPSSTSVTPVSVGRARKRKRLQEVVSRMVASGGGTPAINKRRSSISDAGLSCTPSPTAQLTDETEAISGETPRKHLSPRHQVFLELVQTESNYVGILSTIMTLFKEPLEQMCETDGQLLNLTELKIIFGHLPPIYQTHCQMLEQLRLTATHWTEDVSIGNIFLKFAPDLVKAYPPFVNFFENTREMLMNCDQSKPRFHAFLKICQTKPECGRQSLQELLIRPIQRLASITLLLNDILKHTAKNNNDHTALEAALNVIREVMTHINEDKRRTEGQLAMFDIFNDIDNCPPHLVSSHRSFIARCDLTELSDSLSGRGDPLAFFLFSDILEVCKKRSKAFHSNSMKSPNTTGGTAKLGGGKPFKHVRLMPLSAIKRVIDIKETDECHKVFALMCKSNQELKEKLYSFMITSEETDKMVFLKQLCRQMANTVCRADAENFLASLDPEQLDIDTSDVGLGTLGKAFKFASRTRMRVGRAFSFNKTPSKLKRAMSTMMSPFGSSSNLTPASQLAQMRLASCNNLNELGSSPQPPPPQYAVPMSVQPQRRAKHATLSVASLRRL